MYSTINYHRKAVLSSYDLSDITLQEFTHKPKSNRLYLAIFEKARDRVL